MRPSLALYGTVQYGQCQLRDTVPPTPVRLRIAPLEGGRRNPRKGYGRLPRVHTGRRRDVGLVERVSSANSGLVRPSPPLYYRPGHCSAIPCAVGARDDEISPRPLLYTLQPSVSMALEPTHGRRSNKRLLRHYLRSRSWMDTGLVATPRQKQDSPG
jgi:hypothetical protein